MAGRTSVLVSVLALAGCTKGPCEPRCLEVGKCAAVTTGTAEQCVDCLEDRHCRGNPLAFGPTCDVSSSRCVCASDAECAGNRNGGQCDDVVRRCHCDQDSDCLPGLRCAGQYLSTRICVAPCRSDDDCPDRTAPHCDVASGDCLACVTSNHCEDSPEGTRCEDHQCACETDADCKGSYPWGNRCRTGAGWCGCEADADCTDNPNGPKCADNNRCTCDKDSDCTRPPYTDCALPHGQASYMHCQRPCTADADCAGKGSLGACAGGTCVECIDDAHCPSAYSPYCDAQRKACVECTTDAHCSGSWCDAETGWCVQCTTDADCSSSSVGPWCRDGRCECETDADCSKSPDGSKCTYWYCGCDGDADCTDPSTSKCRASGRCGCEVDANCNKDPNGSKCNLDGSCGCETDAQCTIAPYTICPQADAYSSYLYLYCQEPCASDADCADKWSQLNRCKLGDARCVQCLGDGDCNSSYSKYCLLASNSCVECRSDLDCSGGSRPLCLVSTGKCVSCSSDQDCAKSEDGKACDAASGQCTCRTDADCASLPFKKVCDPTAGCRECRVDSDCGPASLGNKCGTSSWSDGTCECGTDEDCASNVTGHKCNWQICSCVTNADCPPPRKCTGYYFSVAICQ